MNHIIVEEIREIKSLIKNKVHRWLSLKDCVKYSGLSLSSLRRAIWSGRLRAKKPQGKYVIRVDWLEKYLNS